LPVRKEELTVVLGPSNVLFFSVFRLGFIACLTLGMQMSQTNPNLPEMTPAQRHKARIAGVIGNVVEWYGFAL
jgi:hypothetical protein